ncbi:MAG: MFS transporter [Deltaproteobacteria bacterium]|nr:MFS transporter [Deltaproteobacteria bacterium]MBW2152377.1 MFS transporter [Deltaproteobacteria bacterium]
MIHSAVETAGLIVARVLSGVTWLFVVSHFSHHVITALVVPLLPFIRNDFSLDYTQSGLVISAFTLSYGIAQMPAGWLADRLGPQKLITLSITGVAFAGLLMGLSQTYILMICFLILMGLCGGGYHPSAPPLISASVKPENRGFALGCHVIGGSASYFLSPLIGAYIATALGWRGAFISLAIPTIIFGIIFHVVLGRKITENGMQQPTEAKGSEKNASGGFYRPILAFLILSTSVSAIMTSTIAFIPLFIVDHFGVAEKNAAALMALVYSTGLWAAPIGGYLSDRLGSIPVIVAICFISGPTMFLMNIVPYGIGFAMLLLIVGSIIMIRMPVSEAYIVGEIPQQYRSTVLGVYFFCSIEGGGVLTPVMGGVMDHFGFFSGFAIAGAVIVIITLICSFFLREKRSSVVSKSH